MAPKMKAAMKGTAMTKGALADALATKCELKKSEASKILAAVAEIGTEEVKKAGVFSLPGLVRIKTRKKAATKAGKKEMFGKMVLIKARPAKTVVKAFPVASLKNEF